MQNLEQLKEYAQTLYDVHGWANDPEEDLEDYVMGNVYDAYNLGFSVAVKAISQQILFYLQGDNNQ